MSTRAFVHRGGDSGSSLGLFGPARTALPGARWLLDRHLAAGDFCVIASASPQPLVEAEGPLSPPSRRG